MVQPLTLPAVREDAWELTGTGLRIRDPDLTYEAFENLCTYLGDKWATVAEASWALKFAVGDAIVQGEALFEASAYQAFERFGLSEEVMRECARVSQRVPYSTRRRSLSWSHHRAVAALEPAEQKQWLKEAAQKELSHAALREELRNGHEPREISTCRCCGAKLQG